MTEWQAGVNTKLVTVTVKKTYTKEFARLRRIGDYRTKVGVHDDGATYDDGTRVIEVAVWNHFGTSNIPARPFITESLALAAPELRALYARLVAGVIAGKITDEFAAQYLGQWAQKEIIDNINRGFFQSNAPSTVAAKGSSTPLIDTAQLKGAIRASVERVR